MPKKHSKYVLNYNFHRIFQDRNQKLYKAMQIHAKNSLKENLNLKICKTKRVLKLSFLCPKRLETLNLVC